MLHLAADVKCQKQAATRPQDSPHFREDLFQIVWREIDFANALPAAISGTVFNDLSGDRSQGPLDRGFGGWTVNIDADDDGQAGALVLTTTTDLLGQFSFTGLKPGTYIIHVAPGSGYQPTNHPGPVTVQSGSTVSGLAFGYRV
ncbi:MAG TPA: SdrD B-like domain-containing protein [Tepidisphaeraceae bacterium]|nr:SdrD B-like domain-containing protein [Tepidisphaeraceae bacterium]